MTTAEVTLAIAALLVTPGPTNTLLAVAGAEGGVARATRLIPAELGGYLVTVLPLTFAGVELLAAYPGIKPAITLLAAIWVMWLAITMWRLQATTLGVAPVVTARQVFVTTVLNPKALIFGLVILPSESSVWTNIGNFTAQVVVVATLWAALGAAVSQTPEGRTGGVPAWLRRIAALWLAFVSVGLLTRVLTA